MSRVRRHAGIEDVLRVMARLRAPNGCPWDRKQTHRSLRFHAVEEVYELMDAIERGDDLELAEELGDLLLQVVFHCQLARERRAFDFDRVCRILAEKLVRRHPHVFGGRRVTSVEGVWEVWERIKREEKAAQRRQRHSALDGIPRQLPALLRAEKLLKKVRRAGLGSPAAGRRHAPRKMPRSSGRLRRGDVAARLFALVALAESKRWCAEELLRSHLAALERNCRREERRRARRA